MRILCDLFSRHPGAQQIHLSQFESHAFLCHKKIEAQSGDYFMKLSKLAPPGLLILLLLIFLLLSSRPFLHLSEISHIMKCDSSPVNTDHQVSPPPKALKFVTLSFNNTKDTHVIDHNCARLQNAGYVYEIHTDDITMPCCKTCQCIYFQDKNCSCPRPNKGQCNLCNKLIFLVDMIKATSEFVFLDSDVVILKDEFMPALQIRSKHFDFLGTYGSQSLEKQLYRSQFSSGLMFIRRIDGLFYDEIFDIRDELVTNGDQQIISKFIHKYYSRWDVLSFKWHCRYLERPEFAMNISDCFTYHAHRMMRRKFLRDFEWSKTAA